MQYVGQMNGCMLFVEMKSLNSIATAPTWMLLKLFRKHVTAELS